MGLGSRKSWSAGPSTAQEPCRGSRAAGTRPTTGIILLVEGHEVRLLAAPAKGDPEGNQIPSVRGDSRAWIAHLTCPALPS